MGQALTLPTARNSVPGAILAPPSAINSSIKRAVETALAGTKPRAHRALVAVSLDAGINFVYAYRPSASSPWEIDAYFGKNWQGKPHAGVQIVWSK